MTKNIQVTNVYERNRACKKRIVVNIGGARSSKSYSIAQLFIEKLFNEKNKNFLITKKTFPSLRLTAYKLIIDLLEDYGLYGRCIHNKTEHYIEYPGTKSRFQFLSLDNPVKIKSSEWNYIWMEEADDYTWDDWRILHTRLSGKTIPTEPNQIFLSLNPEDENGWINQEIIANESNLEIIWSNMDDNPFLSSEYREILDNLKETDPEGYKIYRQGKWGALTNIIYQPYTVLNEFPKEFDETIYGLDFGFNVPSALIEIGIKDYENCYLRELLYKTKLNNSELIEELKILIPSEFRQRPIYADNAEPDRINEIFDAGFNVIPSDKSVNDGIDFCKRKKFFTLESNINLNDERKSYRWKKDKNDNILDEPIKFKDHLMDAKRYALYTHYKDNESGADMILL